MCSLFTHAYVGHFIHKNLSKADPNKELPKNSVLWLTLTVWFLTILPDFDVAGLFLGIPYAHPLGHRGVTHSIAFALFVAVIAALIFTKIFPYYRKERLRLFIIFALATFSHALLDAFTNGGLGVAFFSPISNHRYFFPITPIEVSPLGVRSFFSLRGVSVLFNEFVWIVLPLLIFNFFRFNRNLSKKKVLFIFVPVTFALSALTALALIAKFPRNTVRYSDYNTSSNIIEGFNSFNNVFDASKFPLTGPPRTNFDDMLENKFFNRKLTIENQDLVWSSSFFPSWYGGIAGRWMQPRIYLIFRTLFGYKPPSREEAINLLHWATKGDKKSFELLYQYSPSEKYDLALGNYDFPATTAELTSMGHNRKKFFPFWTGYCDGLAATSIHFQEPFRKVTVINPDGFKIVFHPNDVKGLLGKIGTELQDVTFLGKRCDASSRESADCRDINPATLVLAIFNKFYLEKKSFVLETSSFEPVHNFPLYDAQIDIINKPLKIAETIGMPVDARYAVDVKITLGLSSTNIPDYSYANNFIPNTFQDGYYEAGNRTRLEKVYYAQLAMNNANNILGGKWTNAEQAGPDFIWFAENAIKYLEKKETLTTNKHMDWRIIKAIHLLSVSKSYDPQVLDLRTLN